MNKYFQFGHLVLTIILFVFLISIYNKTKKTGFVITSELFTSFKMTTEIDSDIKKIELSKQAILDSLTLDWERKKEKNESVFFETQKKFLQKKQQFADDLSRLKQNSIDKVNKQINQYCIDYAEENGYDIIFGANGQGSLMYANDSDNLTKVMIEYINKKYEGVH